MESLTLLLGELLIDRVDEVDEEVVGIVLLESLKLIVIK